MSLIFPDLFGNEATKDRLGRALADGTLPHALILSGPRGSGRRTLGRLIASALFCERAGTAAPLPCGECEACRRVREGIFPDLHIIAPEEGKSLIPVARIREMRAEMSLSASEADFRVFLIEEAERMNAAAQNALLVSLEEPPEGVFILLVTESEEALLTTVRSRSQTVRTELFEPPRLREFLMRDRRFLTLLHEDPEKADALLEGAHGRIGEAYLLLGSGALSDVLRRRETVDAVIAALGEGGAAALYGAMRPFSAGKREEVLELLTLLSEALRDLILIKKAPAAPLLYYTRRKTAETAAERVGIRRLFALSDAVLEAGEDLSRNANLAVVAATLTHAALR